MRKWIFLLGVLAMSSPAALAAAPTTQPVIIKLADAVALPKLLSSGREATMTDKLNPPRGPLYFGELDLYDDTDEDPVNTVPIIATKNQDAWSALPLAADGLPNPGWKFVGAGPTKKEIWAGLDTVIGDPGPVFLLAHSMDGGETFSLQSIKKPVTRCEFFDFAMNADGHGRATVSLDKATNGKGPGLYHFDTTDGGKSWNAARYEPDAIERADPVPDDEQPDNAATGSRTSWRGHSNNSSDLKMIISHHANRAGARRPASERGRSGSSVINHGSQSSAND